MRGRLNSLPTGEGKRRRRRKKKKREVVKLAPVKVLKRSRRERAGDGSSGAGPCSVVNTSKTVTFIHTDLHSLSHTNTQGSLVKAVVAGEAAVRPGQELENRWSGLMAVKAPITESVLLPRRPRLSPHPSLLCSAARLSIAHSNDIRLAGTCGGDKKKKKSDFTKCR